MAQWCESIQLFEERKVRTVRNDEQEKWYSPLLMFQWVVVS